MLGVSHPGALLSGTTSDPIQDGLNTNREGQGHTEAQNEKEMEIWVQIEAMLNQTNLSAVAYLNRGRDLVDQTQQQTFQMKMQLLQTKYNQDVFRLRTQLVLDRNQQDALLVENLAEANRQFEISRAMLNRAIPKAESRLSSNQQPLYQHESP